MSAKFVGSGKSPRLNQFDLFIRISGEQVGLKTGEL
jgi:hypothetical protein